MLRQSPGHRVGSMLIPLARSCKLPVDCSTSAARLHLHASWDGAVMELRLGPLFVKAALPLVAVYFPAGQRQSFKHALVSKFRLGIWLLACTLGRCALVLSRRLVLLIHRRLKCVACSCSLLRSFTGYRSVQQTRRQLLTQLGSVRCRTFRRFRSLQQSAPSFVQQPVDIEFGTSSSVLFRNGHPTSRLNANKT